MSNLKKVFLSICFALICLTVSAQKAVVTSVTADNSSSAFHYCGLYITWDYEPFDGLKISRLVVLINGMPYANCQFSLSQRGLFDATSLTAGQQYKIVIQGLDFYGNYVINESDPFYYTVPDNFVCGGTPTHGKKK